MNAKSFEFWKNQYFDALIQAAGAARILGLKDEAFALHRMSIDAINIETNEKPKPKKNKPA